MLLAYNTNGLAEHTLLDAIALLAEIGYQGIGITLNNGALNPYDDAIECRLGEIGNALAKHGLRCVIETGARYLLDSRRKHEPTLVSADAAGRARRIDFLNRAIRITAQLNAKCVSLWSGVLHDGAAHAEAMARLVAGLAPVLETADRYNVILAFEPEPGMLIDTLQQYDELLDQLDRRGISSARLLLTIDIGHLHCQGEVPIAEKIGQYRHRLANVHIEDMRRGVHEHLMFGEGEIDFRPVIAALAEIRYHGLMSVELSRHSHEGPEAARRAYSYLRPLIDAATHA